MQLIDTAIPDVKLVRPVRRDDDRGWLAETWRSSVLGAAGIPDQWAQENLVYSRAAGTLRALHFQAPPHAQGKFITVTHGAIFDVAVDIRRGSPHFGRHVAVRLDRETLTQIWMPPGFAHGYLTLEPDTQVVYRMTRPYAPQAERGIRWNDPSLGIPWPVLSRVIVNDRDKTLPLFGEIVSPFTFNGGV